MKNPEFPGKPVENQTKEDIKNTIETIPQDVNTIQDFFNNTENGRQMAKRIEPIVKSILDNPVTEKDLRSLNTRSLVIASKTAIATGKPYEQYIEQAIKESFEYDFYLAYQSIGEILDFYIELNLPPDKYTGEILDFFKKRTQDVLSIEGGDFISKITMGDPDLQLRKLSSIYTKVGNFEQAYEFTSYIKDRLEKDKQMMEIAFRLDKNNAAREDLFSEIEINVLNEITNEKNKYKNDKELSFIINIFAKDGQLDRALNLTEKMTSPEDRVNILMVLVDYFKKADRDTGILFKKSIESIEYIKADSSELYSDMIAGYIKIGDFTSASKLILKDEIKDKSRRHLLDKIPTGALLNPEIVGFVESYIVKSGFIGPLSVNESEVVRTLSRIGKFEEALQILEEPNFKLPPELEKLKKDDKISKGTITLSKDLEALIFGINSHILTVSNIRNKKEDPYYTNEEFINESKKIFNSGKIDSIFWMSYYFKNVLPNLDEYLEHVKIPANLGIALRADSKISPYDIGELHNPVELRAFLRSMEHYSFKTVSDFLEKVFNVLPAEGDNVIYEYISQNPEGAPRLIKNLIDIDNTKGTQYAVNFMSRKNVPDKIFSYFTYLCIENGRFSKNVNPLIKNPENMDSLRKLISQFPNQFNNVADVCAGLGITDLSKESDLWEALKDISPITPGIYAKYRKLNPKEKIEFKEWLSKFDYSNFFKNEPMDLEKLSIEDREVIIDLLYRAYNPVNMSFTAVKELLETVADRTKDLKEYKIRDDYPVNFKTVSFELKKEESLSVENLNKIKGFFEQKETADPQEPLLRLARATTDFTHEESLALFNLMNSNTQVTIQRNNWIESNNELGQPDSSGMKTFRALGSSKELFGIFTEDNLPAAITNYLEQDPKLKERFENIISRPERRINLLKALGYQEDNEFTKEIPTLSLIAQVFSEKVLSKYTILANKELRKYVKSEDISTAVIPAKMYISKNQGSFFSKSAAGLCTSRDVELWNKPNHFHINVVNEENQIKGLTMAYIENINDKKSLVLRGFNPTVQYLESTSPVSFVEESIGVAREFMKDNNIEDLYIIDNSGDRLSNRPTIVSYVSAYISNLEKVPYEMVIAGSDSKVSAVRKVEQE